MKKEIKIAVYVVFTVAFVAVGYLMYRKYIPEYSVNNNKNYYTPGVDNSDNVSNNVSPKNPPVPKPVSNLIAGYSLYKNVEFGFEIQYPATWAVSEEVIENVRGEQTKAFYFNPPAGGQGSDLRFAILPRDGLSYGLPDNGVSSQVMIGGSSGVQIKYTTDDGRRLWLIHPNYGLYNWSQDIGRIDMLSGATDPTGDTATFEKMLSTFKLSK